MTRIRAVLVAVLVMVASALSAQDAPLKIPADCVPNPSAGVTCTAPTPTLTEIERLRVEHAALKFELAQLRAQVIQKELETSRAAFVTLLRALSKPGYDLDLQTLTYTPAAKAPSTGATP